MLKTDVLFDTFWKNITPEKRIPKIAACGYKYVETWLGGDAGQLKNIGIACRDNGLELVSIVMNFATDAEVAPVNRDKRQNFIDRIDRYSDNALAAGCRQGIVTAGQSLSGCDYQTQRAVLVEALRMAGEPAAKKGFKLNLELLNTEIDHPGYFLDIPRDGVAIVKETGLDNIRMLFDIYHMGIMGGNLTAFITRNIDYIGHFHAAGIPGRHELFNGETNYPFILDAIEKSGYQGYFGLEYMPQLESGESLRKTLAYLACGK
ncbi:MAG: TIM barrel protein [Victivallales bacterium]|nr:TIM barrel protein [Victivallales bacterium]